MPRQPAFPRLIGVGALLALAACHTDVAAPACVNGLDDDQDGRTDFPDDPGCATPFDNDEKDPGECGDGIDNDKDGLVDWPADPACDSPNGESERLDPRRPAACGDGLDNDKDGKTDYPNEPGCLTSHDDDETDPTIAPQCADGVDNDQDGATDHPADTGCDSASGDDEASIGVSACGPRIVVTDITKTGEVSDEIRDKGGNAIMGACGGYGTEHAYRYDVAAGKALDIEITTDVRDDRGNPLTTLDTVLYVRGRCRDPMTEIACNDDAAQGVKGSTVVVHAAPAGPLFILVDTFGPGSLGRYTLKVKAHVAKGSPCDPVSATETCAPGLVCRPPLPGMPASCEDAVCRDGRDNDADGKTDFPDDPGCVSPDDPNEADGSTPPECGDGIDNDLDGKTDYPDDPGCVAAADGSETDECVAGLPVDEVGWAGVVDTTGGVSRTAGTCSFASTSSPEKAYLFRNERVWSTLTFTTASPDTALDTVLYVRAPDCASDGSERACNDDAPGASPPGASAVTIKSPAAGPYYVFVDGKNGAAGTFRLTVRATVGEGETCAPGSTLVGCDPGQTCKGAPGAATCQKTACANGLDDDADGKVDFPEEPGCSGIDDDDESDPAIVPACANGADDDADGKTDFPSDPGCRSASDDGEIDLCLGADVPALPPAGVVATLPSDFVGTSLPLCSPAGSGATLPEHFYSYVVTEDLKSLSFSTEHPETTGPTVLAVRRDACLGGTELSCAADKVGAPGSTVTLLSPFRGTYYVIVDSHPPAPMTPFVGATYKLTATAVVAAPAAPACDVHRASCTPAP